MDDCQEVIPVIELRENLQQAPTTSEAIEEEIIPMYKTKCNFQPKPCDSEVKGEEDDSSMDQNLCSKLKDWSSEKWVMLKAPVGQVVCLIDLATDIYTTCKFYINGAVVFATLGCCFIVIPLLCNMLLSLLGFAIMSLQSPGAKKPWGVLIALHFLPITPLLWYAPSVHLPPLTSGLQTKQRRKMTGRQMTFTLRVVPSLLIFTECYLESIPQFLTQSFYLLTSPTSDAVDILTIFSSLSSLLALSWASSGLWFAVRDHMYFPCPCNFFQISSLLHYLSNFCMLSGRLLALSYFAALIGLMPLVYVVLAQACMAIITDLLVNWGHTARSEQSKENVVSRLLETCSLVFDVPFSITFMSGPARKGCYCLWFFETLFLIVFSFCWPSQLQEHTATNATLTVLETSSDLKSFLLALVLVFATLGILLRYLHYRKELNNLKNLDQNICEFSAMLEANWNVMGDLELLPEVFSKTREISTQLPRLAFANIIDGDLREGRKELRLLKEQLHSTGVPEEWQKKYCYAATKIIYAAFELNDLRMYFLMMGRLHKTSSLGVYRKTLDAFAANMLVGNENLYLREEPPYIMKTKDDPHLRFSREPRNWLQRITMPFLPTKNSVFHVQYIFVWPTRRDAYKHFEADILPERRRIELFKYMIHSENRHNDL